MNIEMEPSAVPSLLSMNDSINKIPVAPYGHNFGGSDGRSDGITSISATNHIGHNHIGHIEDDIGHRQSRSATGRYRPHDIGHKRCKNSAVIVKRTQLFNPCLYKDYQSAMIVPKRCWT